MNELVRGRQEFSAKKNPAQLSLGQVYLSFWEQIAWNSSFFPSLMEAS